MPKLTDRTLDALNRPKELIAMLQRECGADKDGKGFICPFCGNGNHGGRGEGVRLTKQGRLICTGCADGTHQAKARTPISYLTQATGKNFQEVAKMVADELGVQLEYEEANSGSIDYNAGWQSRETAEQENQQTATQSQQINLEAELADERPELDFTEYLKKCYEKRGNTLYWQSRGLSIEVIEKYRLGYDEAYRATGKSKPVKVGVIPCGKHFYIARNIDKATNESMKVYNPSGAKAKMFNTNALYDTSDRPVFVVEGAIDALSIIDVGGAAVGLNSTSNISLLVDACKIEKPRSLLIIAMDYDRAGKKAAETLKKELDNIGVESMIYELTNKLAGEPPKDANEYLQQDRKGLQKAISGSIEEWRKKKLIANSDLGQLDSILQEYEAEKETFSTGFNNLDAILGGGLYSGLYIIGAISSLGKTTFIRQIACNLAEAGNHVLYFSLEMSTGELVAKDLSRLSYGVVKELSNLDPSWKIHKHALTTRDILSRYKKLDEWKRWALDMTINDKYRPFAGNIWTYSGVGDISIADIETDVERHINDTGIRPVIFIDYLQIMQPLELKDSTGRVRSLTDKQQIDEAVKRLKLLSEKYRVPVVAISSFNRASYLEPINMASYKESGAIEYSSDCLIGLQYSFMEYQKTTKKNKNGEIEEIWEIDKDRNLRIREAVEQAEANTKDGYSNNIQCKVLKNRNGHKGSCYFDYYAKFNYYRPALLPKEAFSGKDVSKSESEINPFTGNDFMRYYNKKVKDYAGIFWQGKILGNKNVMENTKTKARMPFEKWLAMNEAGEKAKQTAPQSQQIILE